jgi:hypothetical protein
VAGLDQPTIGNQQRAVKMKCARELTSSFDGPPPEDHTCPRLKVEGDHLQ